MMKWLIYTTLALAFCAASAWARQENGVEREILLGNEAYAKFDNQKALQHFLTALDMDPNNYQALWKGARAYADVGRTFEHQEKNRAKLMYQTGDSLARKCVALYPDSADAHFALALCVGRVALFEGGKTKIRLSKEVKQEADLAVALQPTHDAAYHILGRWHYNIATLGWALKAVAKIVYGGVPPGATLAEAAKMFERALALNGEKPVHRLEYGRTLIALEQYDEARVQLQECMALPQAQWDDDMSKAEAARLLKTIAGKHDKKDET
ncbi:tetratricopeptide repeat protein [bacterium]|nr:tetratricopeptide repeat protein [bacterium]RIK76334.1 MAG: hypothetical protein DCC62_11590 [candidate division KSB1 bacterium]